MDDQSLFSARGDSLAPERSFLAPRDEVESRLARIWEDLLDDGLVGAGDNFIARGGDSLLSVRLLHRVNDEFGIKLPLATLDSAPTLGDLARILRNGGEAGSFTLVELNCFGPAAPVELKFGP